MALHPTRASKLFGVFEFRCGRERVSFGVGHHTQTMTKVLIKKSEGGLAIKH